MPIGELTTEQPSLQRSTLPRSRRRPRARRQPRYHIVLWNDDDHTYDYVIRMLRQLFAYTAQQGIFMADEVHHRGRAVLLTTTKEHAELKRDQIAAFGRDGNVRSCQGSMSASIESEA